MDDAGDQLDQLKREQICHQWQLEETDGIDSPGAASTATCRGGRRAAETVDRLGATEPRPEDTAILLRRNGEGRSSDSDHPQNKKQLYYNEDGGRGAGEMGVDDDWVQGLYDMEGMSGDTA